MSKERLRVKLKKVTGSAIEETTVGDILGFIPEENAREEREKPVEAYEKEARIDSKNCQYCNKPLIPNCDSCGRVIRPD